MRLGLCKHSLISLMAAVLTSPARADDGTGFDRLKAIDTSQRWAPAEQDVDAIVNAAPRRAVENVVQPVHTIRYDGDDNLIWAPNPDGKTWDVLPVYFQGYAGPTTLPIIDLGSGQVTVQTHPDLNWHLSPDVLAPNGTVYISTLKKSRVVICIYDPSENRLTLDAVPVPGHLRGEMHPIVRSTDGMIFAGGGHSSQAAACIMIDPTDNSVTDYGACGPSHKPSNCYNYTMGADDTHVYLASGKVPWYLVAVDRRTQQSTVLAETANSGGIVVVTQDVHGVVARVTRGPGQPREDYWCHLGKLVPESKPCPWGRTGTDWQKSLPPKPEIDSTDCIPAEPGTSAEFRVRQPVPGVPRDRDWSQIRYELPLYPAAIQRLVETPDGRLFGSADSYTGHFIFDPATGECLRTNRTRLSHYATAVHDNRIWMSGYPAARLYVFDCSRPATADSGGIGPVARQATETPPETNPQLLGRFEESRCHKMYGAAVGASGHLYFGGRWMRNGNGGGLGWWNPATQAESGLWKPFSNHQIAFLCAADDGKHIVISTVAVTDTVLRKPTPREGKLFILDDSTKQLTREITVARNVRGAGPVVWAGGNRVIGWTTAPDARHQSSLYGVDIASGETIWNRPLPFNLPIMPGSNQTENWDFRIGPDGWLWTFMGRKATKLVRIDPETVRIEVVANVDKGGRLAFSGSDVYLSGTRALRRIRNVVARK